MILKNFKPREKIIAIATAAVAGGALIYNFAVEPMLASRRTETSEVESRAGAFNKSRKIFEDYGRIESEYKELTRFATAEKGEDDAVAAMLTYIEDIARRDSCFIVNVKPAGSKTFARSKEIMVDVTAEGDIEQFSKFIYDLEHPRIMMMKIKRFSLASKGAASGGLRGSFIISKTLLK